MLGRQYDAFETQLTAKFHACNVHPGTEIVPGPVCEFPLSEFLEKGEGQEFIKHVTEVVDQLEKLAGFFQIQLKISDCRFTTEKLFEHLRETYIINPVELTAKEFYEEGLPKLRTIVRMLTRRVEEIQKDAASPGLSRDFCAERLYDLLANMGVCVTQVVKAAKAAYDNICAYLDLSQANKLYRTNVARHIISEVLAEYKYEPGNRDHYIDIVLNRFADQLKIDATYEHDISTYNDPDQEDLPLFLHNIIEKCEQLIVGDFSVDAYIQHLIGFKFDAAELVVTIQGPGFAGAVKKYLQQLAIYGNTANDVKFLREDQILTYEADGCQPKWSLFYYLYLELFIRLLNSEYIESSIESTPGTSLVFVENDEIITTDVKLIRPTLSDTLATYVFDPDNDPCHQPFVTYCAYQLLAEELNSDISKAIIYTLKDQFYDDKDRTLIFNAIFKCLDAEFSEDKQACFAKIMQIIAELYEDALQNFAFLNCVNNPEFDEWLFAQHTNNLVFICSLVENRPERSGDLITQLRNVNLMSNITEEDFLLVLTSFLGACRAYVLDELLELAPSDFFVDRDSITRLLACFNDQDSRDHAILTLVDFWYSHDRCPSQWVFKELEGAKFRWILLESYNMTDVLFPDFATLQSVYEDLTATERQKLVDRFTAPQIKHFMMNAKNKLAAFQTFIFSDEKILLKVLRQLDDQFYQELCSKLTLCDLSEFTFSENIQRVLDTKLDYTAILLNITQCEDIRLAITNHDKQFSQFLDSEEAERIICKAFQCGNRQILDELPQSDVKDKLFHIVIGKFISRKRSRDKEPELAVALSSNSKIMLGLESHQGKSCVATGNSPKKIKQMDGEIGSGLPSGSNSSPQKGSPTKLSSPKKLSEQSPGVPNATPPEEKRDILRPKS